MHVKMPKREIPGKKEKFLQNQEESDIIIRRMGGYFILSVGRGTSTGIGGQMVLPLEWKVKRKHKLTLETHLQRSERERARSIELRFVHIKLIYLTLNSIFWKLSIVCLTCLLRYHRASSHPSGRVKAFGCEAHNLFYHKDTNQRELLEVSITVKS